MTQPTDTSAHRPRQTVRSPPPCLRRGDSRDRTTPSARYHQPAEPTSAYRRRRISWRQYLREGTLPPTHPPTGLGIWLGHMGLGRGLTAVTCTMPNQLITTSGPAVHIIRLAHHVAISCKHLQRRINISHLGQAPLDNMIGGTIFRQTYFSPSGQLWVHLGYGHWRYFRTCRTGTSFTRRGGLFTPE